MGLRTLFTAALAIAAVAVQTGCGQSCKNESPKICAVPAGCIDMAPNVPVTVSLKVAPTCNQAAPRCTVIWDNLATGTIQLEALSEACDSSSSCPLPSCANESVTCSFVAPAVGDYTIFVFDAASGNPIQQPFKVVASGVQTACTI